MLESNQTAFRKQNKIDHTLISLWWKMAGNRFTLLHRGDGDIPCSVGWMGGLMFESDVHVPLAGNLLVSKVLERGSFSDKALKIGVNKITDTFLKFWQIFGWKISENFSRNGKTNGSMGDNVLFCFVFLFFFFWEKGIWVT